MTALYSRVECPLCGLAQWAHRKTTNFRTHQNSAGTHCSASQKTYREAVGMAKR